MQWTNVPPLISSRPGPSPHNTGCDRILKRFLWVNGSSEGPSVLYGPFRVLTPRPTVMLGFGNGAHALQEKRLSIYPCAFCRSARISWFRPLFARLNVIFPINVEDVFHPLPYRCILDRATNLDTSKKLPHRPVSTSQINLRLARVFESVNSAVLQKSTDDASYGNIFAHPWYTRAQTANAPN